MKTKKSITLAAAVAASLSSATHAVAVSGTVTAMQWAWGTVDILANPNAVFNPLVIGGDTVTGLTLSGTTVAYTSGTYVGIEWDLTDGMRQGPNGSGGTYFKGGAIYISTSTDGVNYAAFDTVDASVTNLPFLAGMDGHIASKPTQTTAGLVVDDAGYGTLPGLWDLTFFGTGFNNAVVRPGILSFGGGAALFMEGSIAPVPIPAAAWLFGTALISLMGMGRRQAPYQPRRDNQIK